MKTAVLYADDTERQAALAVNASLYLIKDQILEDGNFLIFSDIDPDEEGTEFRKLTLASLTPEQVDGYIDNNVSDLASAITVLKFYGKAILWLARKNRIA